MIGKKDLIQKLQEELKAQFFLEKKKIVIKSATLQINSTAFDKYLERQKEYDNLEDDFNTVKRIANNLARLADEIKTKGKTKEYENEINEDDCIISSNTLDNFLKDLKTTSQKTLHILCLYLGYFGWYDFVYQVNKEGGGQVNQDKWLKDLLDGSKKHFSNRYNHLNISEIILPKWEKTSINTEVSLNDSETPSALIKSVEKLWQEKNKNCLLIGEGGMGKTYSLVQIWKHYLNTPKSPIPIFVSLNRYNDVNEKERESFITNYIIENYFQKRFFSDTDKENLWKLILNNHQTDHNEKPVIILLLDGFNEITVNQRSIRKDIDDWWFPKAKDVQIIISSRYDMRLDYRWHELQKIDLQPLTKKTISEYLGAFDIEIPTSKELLSLLSNPMMLTLFASTDEIINQYSKYPKFEFKLEFTSQGELMWNFFESQLVKYFETIKYNDTEFSYYSFLLKHFIPYIGFKMEKMGMYHVHENKLIEIIDKGCILFFTEKFENTFPVYRSHIAKFDLGEKQFPQTGVRFQKIIDILCGKLQILIQENHSYRFLHQNFRDFSASIHVLNDIQLHLEQKGIPPSLKTRPLPSYVQQFIGEIEGEHKKKVKTSKKKAQWIIDNVTENLLDKQLNNLRGVFDHITIGFAVWNIIETINRSRNELTGCDLSSLNLRNISFNSVRCYRKWGNTTLSTIFDNSILSDDNFTNQGMHSASVFGIAYSPDGKKIVSGSYDKTIKEWLVETGECIKTYEGHAIGVKCVTYSNDGKKILSSAYKLKEFWVDSRRYTDYATNSSPTCMAYSPDNKFFVCGDAEGIITEWMVGKHFFQRTFEDNSIPNHTVTNRIQQEIELIRYSADGKDIITHSKSGIIKKWSVSTGKRIEQSFLEKETIHRTSYNSDYSKRITTNNGFVINEFIVSTGELIMSYQTDSSVLSLAYSPDGEKIVAGLLGGKIQQWSTLSGNCLILSKAYTNEIRNAIYSFDNKQIIACIGNKIAKEWIVKTGICINTYNYPSNHFKSHITYSTDTTKFAVSSDDNVLEYSTVNGKLIREYKGDSALRFIAYNFDGTKIVGVGFNETKVWETNTGKLFQGLEKALSKIRFVTFSPNGNRLATISDHGNRIEEWDSNTGEHIQCYSNYILNLVIIKYQYDGKVLIALTQNNKMCKWDVDSGEMLSPYNKIRYLNRGFYNGAADGVNTHLDICNDGDKVLSYQESHQMLEEYSLTTDTFLQNRVLLYSGLLINGCSFKSLHPNSQLSSDFKKVMEQHEAIF